MSWKYRPFCLDPRDGTSPRNAPPPVDQIFFNMKGFPRKFKDFLGWHRLSVGASSFKKNWIHQNTKPKHQNTFVLVLYLNKLPSSLTFIRHCSRIKCQKHNVNMCHNIYSTLNGLVCVALDFPRMFLWG